MFSIDVFWRKLDFKPAKTGCEDINVDEVWATLRKMIDKKPIFAQLTYLDRFAQVVTGHYSPNKPPVVQKKTRGRPTKKQQEHKREQSARKSLHMPVEESGSDEEFEFPRHSSFVPSQEDLVRPSQSQPCPPYELHRHSSYIPSSFQGGSIWDKFNFPNLPRTKKSENLVRTYGDRIPSVFHPYISKITDVRPDGHCGFRAVAVGLGIGKNEHMAVRSQMLLELRSSEGL